MFKPIKLIFKWLFRLGLLAIIILAAVFVYNFLIDGVTGQASNKCKELVTQNGGPDTITYGELADWIKTQSTSVVKVKEAYYENNPSQIIIKYSILNNLLSGQKTISARTLDKYCGR